MTSEFERDSRYEVLTAELSHLREISSLKEKALDLQAKEYERRLNALNHEAEQLKTMQATFWPREVAEKYVDSQAKISDSLNGRIGAVEKSLWRISGALATIYIVIQFLQRFKIF